MKLYFGFRSFYYKQEVEPKLPALQQIAAGLKLRGLLEKMWANPEVFKTYFVIGSNEITLKVLYHAIEVEYSPDGSNKQSIELDVYKHFCDFFEYSYH